MLDGFVFDGMVFSRKDLLQTDGLPLRGWDKKDLGFVFETGVFVWEERRRSTFFCEHLTNG